ncbi:uncharacterized protein LOC127833493 [Dreissena polymorpha]|uniref:B box-type domain-containing protein n=1 Tax=Dreissena polymorpha TaxID=45954 RepID=A0A9D4JGT7_DREPO|nr:uncharacterized protein LOC127833493 [Dreissena polymorpha]KAH3809539.1 hypothetical protein DPMN_137912 [Dreissena polymorpha]
MASKRLQDSNRDNAGDFIGESAVTQSCEPCMKTNVSKTDTVFCKDCDEYLCDMCTNPHTVYKPVETSPISLSSQPRSITLELLVSVDLQKTADDKEEGFLTGLVFLPNGRLVAVDNMNMKCIILNERLQRLGSPYTFKANPLCVVCVSHDALCVTFKGAVFLLSLSTDNTIRQTRVIITSSNFYSISRMSPSQMVVSTWDDPRPARIISLDGVESDFDHVTFPVKKYKIEESMCTFVQS